MSSRVEYKTDAALRCFVQFPPDLIALKRFDATGQLYVGSRESKPLG